MTTAILDDADDGDGARDDQVPALAGPAPGARPCECDAINKGGSSSSVDNNIVDNIDIILSEDDGRDCDKQVPSLRGASGPAPRTG